MPSETVYLRRLTDEGKVLTLLSDNTWVESEDGDNSLSEGNINEPEPDTQLGEDGAIESVGKVDFVIDGDPLVNVDHIIENFKRLAGLRLRGSTPNTYEHLFRRFAETVKLEQYAKKQLMSNKGKELILSYLLDRTKCPEPSRRTQNAALKTVWEEGLGIPYPVSVRRHLGELPDVQTRQSPRDSDVLPHIKAVEHEEEAYLRVLVLMCVQSGLRPSQACLIRWKHVRFGQDERPEAIITTGREEGNKRMVPIKTHLPQDLAEALVELKRNVLNVVQEDPILPHRKPNGEFEHDKALNTHLFNNQWDRFEKKHKLKHIPPVYFRHWVATICRKANLSDPAANAMQGHKCNSRNMRGRYDNPQDIEILEEQERLIPFGPIGIACPKMEVTDSVPPELIDALVKCLKGQITLSQCTEKIMAFMIRQVEKPVNLVSV